MTAPVTSPLASPSANSVAGPPRLLRAELLKVRTTNLWWIFGLCALAAVGLALVVNSWLANLEIDAIRNPSPNSEAPPPGLLGPSTDLDGVLARNAANIYTSGQYFGLLLVMLLGALMITNEYYHQTATSTYLATPRRIRVVFAKLSAATSVAVAGWAVLTVVSVGIGAAFLAGVLGESTGLGSWDVQRAILMNLLAFVVWAILGIGLGALLRNQLAATLVGAGVYLIGSQAVQLAFIALYQVIDHPLVIQSMVLAPSIASQVMVSAEPSTFWFDENGPIHSPQWWVGLIVLVAYGVVAGVVGSLILRRRDIS
jgi:ABC-2 type transport system permease protein